MLLCEKKIIWPLLHCKSLFFLKKEKSGVLREIETFFKSRGFAVWSTAPLYSFLSVSRVILTAESTGNGAAAVHGFALQISTF